MTSAILSHLENVRSHGPGKWSARCPAHDDRVNSLSVSTGEDGRTLLHCHAGCDTKSIVAAARLEMKDLFGATTLVSPRPRIVAEYDYRDESGQLLYQAVRMSPKTFRQRKPDGNGGWKWELNGVRRVLFGLPELLGADSSQPRFIPEGEKDVLRLREKGLIATTNVAGAGKWKDEYSEALRGQRCIVLPDNDDAGRQHALQVAKSLQGIASSIKMLELPNLPPKGDVSDWLDAEGTVEELQRLADAAPEWDGDPEKGDQNDLEKGQLAELVDLAPPTGPRPTVNRLTDAGNAKRFAKDHGGDVRHCHAWSSWLRWDGKRFAVDEVGAVVELAKQTVRGMFAEAVHLPDGQRAELVKHAIKSEQANRIDAMLRLARSEPGIPVTPEQLDADAWKINALNGVVDLRTGKLLPHDRSYLMTKLAGAEYLLGPEGDCLHWENTLATILDCDDELFRFLRRLFGMALVGESSEAILPILHGSGSNGKTIVTETILDAFGEYGMKAPSDLLLAKQSNEHPTAIADLFGRRLVLAAESDEGRRLAEGTVKELTGGDTIRARRMRENYWSFRPSHTIVLTTNHKPRVRGTDYAIWRRLALVPFSVRFWDADKGEEGSPELKADKGLKAKLKAELGGILRWLVDGCLEWSHNGLIVPSSVTAATNEYRAAEDVLAEFLKECMTFGETYQIKASALRNRLDEWCKTNGERPISTRRVGDYLAAIGIVKRKQGTVSYEGIAEA